MKKLFLMTFVLLAAIGVRAQDVLVTEDGESITAWDVDVSSQKIYYKTAAGEDAPMKSIAKAKVLLWKKADGTKVRIGVDEQPQAPSQTPNQEAKQEAKPKADTPAPDASDPEANERCIFNFNQTDVYNTKKPSNSVAREIVGILHMSPDSKMADKNVEIYYSIYKSAGYSKMAPRTSGIGVNVRNKTDKTIYIYLGNTFFLRHGMSTPFTQSSASQSTAGGNDGSKTTGFSQGVVAIPPQSTIDLGKQEFFPADGKNPFGGDIVNNERSMVTGGGLFGVGATTKTWMQFYWTFPKGQLVKKGETRDFEPGESTIDFGFKLTYSFSEDNTQLYHLDAKLYVAKIIGSSFNPWNGTDNIGFTGEPVYFMIPQLQR